MDASVATRGQDEGADVRLALRESLKESLGKTIGHVTEQVFGFDLMDEFFDAFAVFCDDLLNAPDRGIFDVFTTPRRVGVADFNAPEVFAQQGGDFFLKISLSCIVKGVQEGVTFGQLGLLAVDGGFDKSRRQGQLLFVFCVEVF